MQNWFVVVMGVSTVFLVLVLIIGLCYLLALLCKEKSKAPVASCAPADEVIPNRAELVAALSVAIAEYSGTDASAIRILSIKKI
ncbi:MAG: OadG family protein [Oscillospiraceae bacterium]|nr:OadG family protein [Oscillospiraceae bacterium]